MKAYKGFDKNFKCRDFQFEVGKRYEQTGEIKACENGFHACEYPLEVFGYYPPNDSRYALVEQSGVMDKDGDKTASQFIAVKGELSIAGLVKAAVDFTFSKAKKVKGSSVRKNQGAASATGNQGAASATGNRGAASATGNQGAASATGFRGAASATGFRGAASATGNQGAASAEHPTAVAVAWGKEGRAKGVKGAHIVCAEYAEWNGAEYPLIGAKMAVVDGDIIKEDTYYTLINGEFVEVK